MTTHDGSRPLVSGGCHPDHPTHLEQTVNHADDRLRAAAQRALESLCDLILDTPDPSPEATAARLQLEEALADASAVVSPPTDRAELRDRIAEALTAKAYECDGKCGLSERECYDAHPIHFSAMAGGTTHIDASVTAIADVVLAVLGEPTSRAAVPTDEDFLVAVEEALESTLLPTPGLGVLERTQDALMAVLGPLVTRLRRLAAEAQQQPGEDVVEAHRIALSFAVDDGVEAQQQTDTEAHVCKPDAVLEPVREIVRRLAAHAAGFQDVLDDSDRVPWGRTVGADIAALQAVLAAQAPQHDTEASRSASRPQENP